MFEIELIICMKMDLALNNLQRLICHQIQTTSLEQLEKLTLNIFSCIWKGQLIQENLVLFTKISVMHWEMSMTLRWKIPRKVSIIRAKWKSVVSSSRLGHDYPSSNSELGGLYFTYCLFYRSDPTSIWLIAYQ